MQRDHPSMDPMREAVLSQDRPSRDPVVHVEGKYHVILGMNSAFCCLVGKKEEELIGRKLTDFLAGDSEFIALLDEVYRTGEVRSHVKEKVTGVEPLYWSYTCRPLILGGTAPIGVTVEITEAEHLLDLSTKINEELLINSLRQNEILEQASKLILRLEQEITERDRLNAIRKENERQYKTLANSIPHLAWMATPEGDLFWFNKRWATFTGSSIAKGKGNGWYSVIHPDDLERVVTKLQVSIESGEPYEDTQRLRRHDGEMVWHLSRMLPVRDEYGVIVRWLGTSTDISAERQLEESLRQHAAEMDRSDRRKSEFMATLAHELRNPLAPLRSGLELLDIAGDDPATRDQLQAMMTRQIDQMVLLVEDLMDLSRISRGAIDLRLEHLDLCNTIHRALESTRVLIDNHGHTVVLDLPDEAVYVEADGTRLVQIFSNLLNNAAKYTDAGGTITVQVKAGIGTVEIAVIDTGIGLAPDQLTKVFELFSQVERTNDRVLGGLGIGLSLVKQMVELHEGSISVESEGSDMGSKFTVLLPLSHTLPAEQSTPVADQPKAALLTKCKIMVVDDNSDAADIMVILLGRMGHDVYKACDGVEAVALCEKIVPDMVLMDIGMPMMNGHEACRKMREHAWGKKAFIVALTGRGTDEDRDLSLSAGFDHHLMKPVTSAALSDVITMVGSSCGE